MNKIARRQRHPSTLGLMALEPRWMFDGAAAVDAAHAAPDPSAKTLIPNVPAPVQVRAADPAQDSGKKEVVFVDTSVANYQTLEAAVKPGIEIEEIDGGQSGLAQMAKWAETHAGYDSISILSHGTEASVQIGADSVNDTRSDAVVTLNALRVNGQPLPSWLNFDSRSGTLTGQPPGDFKGTMVVRIIARDDKGQEATITVRINGQPEKTGAAETGKIITLGSHHRDKAVGKIAFTQQLKMAARFAAIRFS